MPMGCVVWCDCVGVVWCGWCSRRTGWTDGVRGGGCLSWPALATGLVIGARGAYLTVPVLGMYGAVIEIEVGLSGLVFLV